MPGLDMMPRPNPDDHEAAMARADLYKLANYSMKLFKMIQDGDQLEGWVQAKITKAADYVASVYHFMEYEMKFSEYGEKLETSDVYTEGVRKQFKNKLMEAKAKLDKLSKKNEKELEEAKFEKSGVRASDKKKGKVDKSERKQYFVKLEKEGKTRGMTIVADEGESEGELRDRVKRDNSGWTIAGMRVKNTVDEAAKPDFLDMDKDGNKKEPMKKAVADKKKGSVKKADEALDMNLLKSAQGAMSKNKKDKESDDNVRKPYGYRGASGSENDDKDDKKKKVKKESTGDYSAKKAAAGKDIGKPGKNFSKIAKSAGEKYGSKERGEKVAGAVLAKLRKGK